MRYIYGILSTLLLLFMATGCVDDALLPGCGEDGESLEGKPYTLTFTVGVPPMDNGAPRTRAIYYGNPTYYEDWIDTQDGLRVLFFISKREKTGANYVAGQYPDTDPRVANDSKNPLRDYFLFESTSRWVTQLPYDDDNSLRYRITVPFYQIGDEETEYRDHWERIRNLLRDYDFKVAIMANHPNEASATFHWGLQESILSAPDIDNLSTATKLKTVNDIHHSVPDRNYSTNTNGYRDKAYVMLADNKNKINGEGTMGPFIDWVTARSQLYGDALGGVFTTKEEARVWIRNFWIPDLIYNEDTDPDIDYQTLYHNYRHIWSYWNFGGLVSDNGLPYSNKSAVNPHINDWEVRNGAYLRQWINTAVANGGSLTDLNTNSKNSELKLDGSMGMQFYPASAKGVITSGSNGKRFYGVSLPKLSSKPANTSVKDCFQFKLNAHSTVVVRYVASSSSTKVNLEVGSTEVSASTSSVTVNGVKLTEAIYSQNIADTPQQAYIYCLGDGATIYDIEVVQDQYIYLTDREGILPSHDHPIPMYGIQKYGALEGFWDDGASFDLTTGGSNVQGDLYGSKTIYLLRAVAKVEVLIPKSLGVPKHVYIHSLNRHVRCEPTDVATPTNEIWKDHDNGCEWKMIQGRGTMYDTDVYNADSYKKKLSWYYGNWLEWGWNFNGYTQWKPDYDNDGPFPRVMNPYINRADCAAFIDVSDYYNDQYYHFLFYMGENLLDAPTNYDGSGNLKSTMVPHIRIRFNERYAATSKVGYHSDLNLMGNDCFRIYFTDGGIAPNARDANGASKIGKTEYGTAYEMKPDNLQHHWPIIRNHVYRFTVLDASAGNMNGLVVDAQNRSADFNFK